MADGAAAAQINADLVAEETRRAVAAHRDPFSAESEARLGLATVLADLLTPVEEQRDAFTGERRPPPSPGRRRAAPTAWPDRRAQTLDNGRFRGQASRDDKTFCGPH